MLLRRVTEHVKDQNWFAVGIDFFIVVIGVFIGLQVANWNDASNASAREAIILQQLKSEFEETVVEMKAAKADNENSMTATRDVLRVIRDGVKPEDDAAFLTTIRGAGGLNQGPPEPTTLVELLSSGSLSDLSSPGVRNALIRYHATTVDFEKTADIVLQRVSAPEGGFQATVYINPDYPDGEFFAKYDWESLLTAREQFQVFFYGKLSLSNSFDELVEHGEAVLSEIEKVQ